MAETTLQQKIGLYVSAHGIEATQKKLNSLRVGSLSNLMGGVGSKKLGSAQTALNNIAGGLKVTAAAAHAATIATGEFANRLKTLRSIRTKQGFAQDFAKYETGISKNFAGIPRTAANVKLLNARMKELGISTKNTSIVTRKFKMEYLGLMFAGMALQRVTVGFLRSAITSYDKAFEKQSKFTKMTNRLTAAWEFFKFRLIETLANSKMFQFFVDMLVKVVDWLSNLSDTSLLAISSALITLAGVATLFMVGGQIMLGLNSFTTFLSTLGKFNITTTTSSLFALAIAVIVVLAVLKGLWDQREDLMEDATLFWEGITTGDSDKVLRSLEAFTIDVGGALIEAGRLLINTMIGLSNLVNKYSPWGTLAKLMGTEIPEIPSIPKEHFKSLEDLLDLQREAKMGTGTGKFSSIQTFGGEFQPPIPMGEGGIGEIQKGLDNLFGPLNKYKDEQIEVNEENSLFGDFMKKMSDEITPAAETAIQNLTNNAMTFFADETARAATNMAELNNTQEGALVANVK